MITHFSEFLVQSEVYQKDKLTKNKQSVSFELASINTITCRH